MAVDDVTMPAPFAAHAAGRGDARQREQGVLGRAADRLAAGPRRRMGALVSARLSLDLGAPVLEQLALPRS